MAEWGDLDARLERKKRIKLRRQQREMKKEHMEMEALERERRKLAMRCEEMAREEELSIAMMRFYRQEEARQRRERERERDMVLYEDIAKVRRRAKVLGLPLTTPGMTPVERLEELRRRVSTRDTALQVAEQAKQRLDALPQKRSRVRRLIETFFTSSQQRNIENAVYEQRCEAIVQLLEPGIPGKKTSAALLNHESQNGMTPVLCMIYQRKLVQLRRVLELGASPDMEARSGMTPVLAAVMTDDAVALSLLVEFKARLDYETQTGVTALHLAADKSRLAMIKELHRYGVDVNRKNARGRTALMQAAIAGHYDAVKTLLAFGADRNTVDDSGESALDIARVYGADHIASLLRSSTAGKDLLVSLQEQDEEEADAPNAIAQWIVKYRHKLPGTLAMEKALMEGSVDRILELLTINDIGYGPNYETASGDTPLLVVARLGSASQVLSCIERNCIVTHTNRRGENALIKAAYRGDAAVLRLLCDAGLSCWSRDFHGHDTFRHLHKHEHPALAASLKLASSEQTPPRLSLGEVDSALIARLKTVAATPAIDTRETDSLSSQEGTDGNEKEDEEDGPSGGEDSEEQREQQRRRKWRIRHRVLRADRKRSEAFEAERDKVRKYGERGRRNGLIAPLPHDPAGRFKFPPCDNCHQSRARKRCFACDQLLCDKCHARLHEIVHRRYHEYEELEPTLMIGSLSAEALAKNQSESLAGSVHRSIQVVQQIKQTLVVVAVDGVDVERIKDVEVEKFERHRRLQREKEIAQVQINVPVAAAKHAQRLGDGTIYTNPSDMELADLYLAQGKLAKARTVLEELQRVIEESLGYADPTMLKIHTRLARIDQQGGDHAGCVAILESALGTFERCLRADDKDLVAAQDLLLQALDALAEYDAAVRHSKRILRLRTVGLQASHSLVASAAHKIDEFVAKRERQAMHHEDLVTLSHLASTTEQAEQARLEKEKALAAFRSLLLEQAPEVEYEAFISFAKREFAEDMVQFWVAVERAKTTISEQDAKAFRAAVVGIFLLYIKSRRIKIITAVQRKRMKKAITTPGKKLPRTVFDEVQALVFEVIYHRVYRRFSDQNNT